MIYVIAQYVLFLVNTAKGDAGKILRRTRKERVAKKEMKYIKVLGLQKKNLKGYYDRKRNVVVVDFDTSLLDAVLVSCHEFIHKILDFLRIEDWLDLFDPLLEPSLIAKNPGRWKRLFRAVFLTECQTYGYSMEEDEQKQKK